MRIVSLGVFRRGGDGVGSSETRRSESKCATPPRVFGSTLPRNPPRASVLQLLAKGRASSQKATFSIRGARHDRIAPHKLNTFRAKALPLSAQRKPQYARRTRATNTLQQKQLSHHNTTMADKWRVPQRLSIDPDRVRKRTDAPTRARR